MKNQQITKQNMQLALSLGIGFAGGLISGVLGGILVSNRLNSARRMPYANDWERSLAQERGHVQASCFVSRVESRYWELFCQRPRLVSQSLRYHLNNNILPGLALYQILRGAHQVEEFSRREILLADLQQIEAPGDRRIDDLEERSIAGHSAIGDVADLPALHVSLVARQ